MENGVQFVNDSWRFVKRTVNLNNFTISYTSEGGFKTKQAAEEAQKRSEAKYEADLKRIKKMANIQYTFKEYIEYWLIEFFIRNTDTSTKTIGVWAVRNLIVPSITQDVLLNYVTADYINDILKRCIPICESAGETSRKFLKDAYTYGLMPKDIREELMDVPRKIAKIELLKKEELSILILTLRLIPFILIGSWAAA